MKKISNLALASLLGLTLAACTPPKEGAPTDTEQAAEQLEPSLVNPESSDATNFQKALEYLDTNGVFFGYANIEGEMPLALELLDIFTQMAVKAAQNEGENIGHVREGAVTQIAQITGLDNLSTIGASSIQISETHYSNKVFLALKESTGFANILGSEPYEFTSLKQIPASALYVYETNINLSELARMGQQSLRVFSKNEAEAQRRWETFLQKSIDADMAPSLTFGELFSLEDVNFVVILTENEQPESEAVEDKFNYYIKLSKLGKFLVPSEDTFDERIDTPNYSGFRFEDVSLESPLLVSPKNSEDLIVASSMEIVDLITNTSSNQNDDLKNLLGKFEPKGNALIYQNARLNEIFADNLKRSLPSGNINEDRMKLIEKYLLSYIFPKESALIISTKTEDGIFWSSISSRSFSDISDLTLALPVVIPAIGVLAQTKELTSDSDISEADQIKHNLRMIQAGGQQHLFQTGASTVTYEEIVEARYFEAFEPVSGESYDHIIIKASESKPIAVTTADGRIITAEPF